MKQLSSLLKKEKKKLKLLSISTSVALLSLSISISISITPNIVNATETTFMPQTLAAIASSQNGYTFTNWTSGTTCKIVDKNRVIVIKASLNQVITMYDSGAGAVADVKGTWISSPYSDNGVQKPLNKYNEPTAPFSPVATTMTNGGYSFTLAATTSETRNIVLFPSGFYVSKNNSNLYLRGC